LTVAAIDTTDTRPAFSNYGSCVDLFAPGVDITSDWNAGDQATKTLSGTSVSAPHVAGTAALYLEAHPGATPAQVASALTSNATPNHVTDPGPGSPNRLDYAAFVVLPVRIFGQDAIDTSIAVSQRAFATPASAGAVVLARSDFFSDALAGGPLAAAHGAPLLITPGAAVRSSLDPRVLTEIRRVLPDGHTVYILGGPLALAPGIDATLEGAGYTVVRVQGPNLFATAVAIAGTLGNPATVFEATGLGFADALSAVPAAIHAAGAIVLTNGPVQAPETAAYLAAHPPTTRYAIGGPLAAAGADPAAIAVFGADLYGTSAAVATTFLAQEAVFGAATGLNYPDALAGGVFMATGGRLGPMLLVNTAKPVPGPIAGYLGSQAVGTQGFVFGGPLAVGGDVLGALQAAIG
jgi:hypothetical protein